MSRGLTSRPVVFCRNRLSTLATGLLRPDGKGRVLVDTRMLRAHNALHNSTVVLKLAYVGQSCQRRMAAIAAWQTLGQRPKRQKRRLSPKARDAQQLLTQLEVST